MDLGKMAVDIARQLEIDKKLPTALLSYDVAIPAYEFICLYLITQIVHEVEPDKSGFHYIPVKLTRMLTGEHGKNNDYRRLNQAIDFLTDKVIKWNVARADKTIDSFRASFISTKRTNSKTGNPHFRINKDIEDLIKTTKVFSPMNLLMLAVFSHMRSSYPLYIHLYDALSRGNTSVQLTFAQLKVLCGVKEDEYVDDFKNFNRKHIKPKSEFIINNSDILFECENFRNGRKVGGVNFFDLKKQEWQQVLFSKENKHEIMDEIVSLAREIDNTLKSNTQKISSDQYIRKLLSSDPQISKELTDIFARYRKYNVTKKKLEPLLKDISVGERGLTEILDMCELDFKRREKTKNPIKSPEKHVFWAVNSGWKDEGYGLKSLQERKDEDVKKEKRAENREAERKLLSKALNYYLLLKKHDISLKKAIDDLIQQAKASTESDAILAELASTLFHDWEIKDISIRGYETKIARRSLGDFLAKKYNATLPIWDDAQCDIRQEEYEGIKKHPLYSKNLEKACDVLNKDHDLDISEIINDIVPSIR